MKRTRTPCSARSGSSRSIVSPKISISASTSSCGRDQFSVENAKTTRSWIAEVDRRLDGAPHGARARAVAGGGRQAAPRRPAAVAVHDDRDRLGDLRQVAARAAAGCGRACGCGRAGSRRAQTSMISASLRFRRSSIFVACSSVSFCTRRLGRALLVVADVAVLDELLEVLASRRGARCARRRAPPRPCCARP